jgi:hypothetical protein
LLLSRGRVIGGFCPLCVVATFYTAVCPHFGTQCLYISCLPAAHLPSLFDSNGGSGSFDPLIKYGEQHTRSTVMTLHATWSAYCKANRVTGLTKKRWRECRQEAFRLMTELGVAQFSSGYNKAKLPFSMMANPKQNADYANTMAFTVFSVLLALIMRATIKDEDMERMIGSFRAMWVECIVTAKTNGDVYMNPDTILGEMLNIVRVAFCGPHDKEPKFLTTHHNSAMLDIARIASRGETSHLRECFRGSWIQ